MTLNLKDEHYLSRFKDKLHKLDLHERSPHENLVWLLNRSFDLPSQHNTKQEMAEKRKQNMPWLDKKNKRFYK